VVFHKTRFSMGSTSHLHTTTLQNDSCYCEYYFCNNYVVKHSLAKDRYREASGYCGVFDIGDA
jgi:hypothetical protein